MSTAQHQTLQTFILSVASMVLIGLGAWQLSTTNSLSITTAKMGLEIDTWKAQTANRYTSLDAARDWERQARVDADLITEQKRLAILLSELRQSMIEIEHKGKP